MITGKQIAYLKAAYGFPSLVVERSFEGYGSRQVLRARTDTDKIVAKMLHGAHSPFLHVYPHLVANGFAHVPTLLMTTHGDNYVVLGDSACYLYAHVEGAMFDPAQEGAATALGQAVSTLHAIPLRDDLPRWDLESVIGDIRRDRLPFLPDAAQALLRGMFPAFLRICSLPVALAHGDLSRPNALVTTSSQSVCLIDWDGCGVGPRVIDLGCCLFALLADDFAFDWSAARALIEAYCTNIQLTDDERNLLPAAAVLFASNNVLMGELNLKLDKIRWFMRHGEVLMNLVSHGMQRGT